MQTSHHAADTARKADQQMAQDSHTEPLNRFVHAALGSVARTSLLESLSPAPGTRADSPWAYARAVCLVALCTGVASLVFPHAALIDLSMIYLLEIVIVAALYGRGPSILASLLSVAAFALFFIPPYFNFDLANTHYLLTFAVMLLVALMISTLTVRIRRQVEAADERERRTAILYALSRDFANNRGSDKLVNIAIAHIGEVFHSRVVILLPDDDRHLRSQPAASTEPTLSAHEWGVIQWVFDHGQPAGPGTQVLPSAQGLYVPLMTSSSVAGVLGVHPLQGQGFLSADQLMLLETFANQTALAIERARLAEQAEHAQVQVETERLRNAVLSSVSHDLKTPLAVITGSISSLLDNDLTLEGDQRRELAQLALEGTQRLNRLVGKLLDVTRLESGGVKVAKDWQFLEDVVGSALNSLGSRVDNRRITLDLPQDLPLIPIDSVLIEQVLINLLENAIKYTPDSSPITICATLDTHEITVEVADRGPGLAPGEEQRIFDKFYRGRSEVGEGAGLGLTICRGIVQAHAGRIWAQMRPGGGTFFRFTLPVPDTFPDLPLEATP